MDSAAPGSREGLRQLVKYARLTMWFLLFLVLLPIVVLGELIKGK